MKKIILLMSLFISIPLSVYAEQDEGSDNIGTSDFSVKVELDKNQKEGVTDYPYILDSGESEYKVNYIVTNNTDSDIVLYMSTANLYTSPQGEYFFSVKEPNGGMVIDQNAKLSNYVKLADSIVLNPHETEKVQASIQLLGNVLPYKGELVGGILFSSDKNSTLTVDDFSVNYTTELIIPLKLEKEVLPAEPPIITTVYPKEDKLYATINNSIQTILKEGEGKLEIRDVDTDKLIEKVDVKDLQMAPSSWVDYEIPIKETLKEGNYKIKLVLGVNGKTNEYEKTITIAEDGKELEDSIKPIIEKGVVTFIILLVLVEVGIFYYVSRKVAEN